AAIFVECHPDPRRAASDGSTMQPLQSMPSFLKPVVAIRRALGAETACP
ncbi:MAG: 3-deoxy-8-phosphooctulonate synthase, partial [Planctomycetes bacterium]|nr:3-deoxy-8-phosphooctulonate synthase [Planctomycetota bacterium]